MLVRGLSSCRNDEECNQLESRDPSELAQLNAEEHKNHVRIIVQLSFQVISNKQQALLYQTV